MNCAVERGYAKPGDNAIILMGRIDDDTEGRDIIKVRVVPEKK